MGMAAGFHMRCLHASDKSVIGRMEANRTRSGALAALRGTLLPNLISGELRVKDTERPALEAA